MHVSTNQVAQFCNYMQQRHADDSLAGTEGAVVTLLTGSDLAKRVSTAQPPLAFVGIMRMIAPVLFESVAAFYAKFTHK